MTKAHSSKQMAADIVQVIDVDVIGNQHATLDAPDKGFDIIFYSNILEYVLFGNGISESISFNKFGVFRIYAPIIVDSNVFRWSPKPEKYSNRPNKVIETRKWYLSILPFKFIYPSLYIIIQSTISMTGSRRGRNYYQKKSSK